MGWTPARSRVAVPAAALALIAAMAVTAEQASAATAGIHFVTPKGGSTVAGDIVWEAGAKKPSVISRVEFRIDGQLRWTDRYAPFTYGDDDGRLDTTTLSNGSHTLKLTAHETNGSRGSATTKITVKNAAVRDTLAPAAPSGLRVTSSSSTGFELAWSVSSDASGIAGYRVYVDGSPLGDVTGTSKAVTGLTCGTAYSVAVDAVDGAGNRSARASLTAATAACPVPPPPPTPAPPPSTAPAPAPALSIGTLSAPAAGATLSGRTPFLVTVTGTDSVDRVEMWVNGQHVGTERTAPYGFGGSDGVPGIDTAAYPDGPATFRAVVVATDGREQALEAAAIIANGSPAPQPDPTPDPTPDPGPTPPPTTGTASVFVAANGSDSASCSAAAPCASFDRAYRVADPGDIVEVAGGTYPKQIIEVDASKTASADVVIRPAAGATVVASYLTIHGKHLEIRGMQSTSGWYIAPGAVDVTLRDIVAAGAAFITSASDVRIIGGEIRDVDSLDGIQIKMHTSGYPEPTDLLIDGLYIHDITRVAKPTAHVECIQFTAGRNVTIRNSRFVDCGTQGVFFKEGLGGQIDNVLVENNFFGKLAGYNTLIFDDYVSNMTARYNSFAQAPRLGSAVGASNIVAYGNVGELTACGSGVTYHHNVWSGVACGTGDVKAAPGFVNAGAFDLRLAPGSAAIGRGDPSNHPATDIFGTVRPLGGAPDAGAHQLS